MLIGVISDTHGTLPRWVEEAFAGVDLIIHAGDVGRSAVLDELGCIAPVVAVRGNMDSNSTSRRCPTIAPRTRGVRVLVVHKPEHVRSLVAATDARRARRPHAQASRRRKRPLPDRESRFGVPFGRRGPLGGAASDRGGPTAGEIVREPGWPEASAVVSDFAGRNVTGPVYPPAPSHSIPTRSKERSFESSQ